MKTSNKKSKAATIPNPTSVEKHYPGTDAGGEGGTSGNWGGGATRGTEHQGKKTHKPRTQSR